MNPIKPIQVDEAIDKWNAANPQKKISKETYKELGTKLFLSFEQSTGWKVNESGFFSNLFSSRLALAALETGVVPQLKLMQDDLKAQAELNVPLIKRVREIWFESFPKEECPLRNPEPLEQIPAAIPLGEDQNTVGKVIRVKDMPFPVHGEPAHIFHYKRHISEHSFCLVLQTKNGVNKNVQYFMRYMVREFGVRSKNYGIPEEERRSRKEAHSATLGSSNSNFNTTGDRPKIGVTGAGNEPIAGYLEAYSFKNMENCFVLNVAQEGLMGIKDKKGEVIPRYPSSLSGMGLLARNILIQRAKVSTSNEVTPKPNEEELGGVILFSTKIQAVVMREFSRYAAITEAGLAERGLKDVCRDVRIIIADYAFEWMEKGAVAEIG